MAIGALIFMVRFIGDSQGNKENHRFLYKPKAHLTVCFFVGWGWRGNTRDGGGVRKCCFAPNGVGTATTMKILNKKMSFGIVPKLIFNFISSNTLKSDLCDIFVIAYFLRQVSLQILC